MSVQSATTRNDYTAGASQTVYAYTFEIKAASDITVIVGGVTKSLNTDYTVSGVGTNSGGNVTLSAAPASGTTVSLVMEMDLARDTDYQANGAFLADDVNNDFDSLWLATNQQETELGRSLRLNQTEPTSDMTLPLKDARKGSVLAFNETTGLPVAGPTIANVDSVAGITGDIATVADNDANITTVAGISGDVTSVANISANVTTVAGNTTNINAVAADASDIGTVASNISNVNTTAGISSDVTTVAGNNVNITTVAGDSSEITTVAGVASDVSIVSGIASDVTAVAGDASDIGTVASSISNVNAVGTNITNVNNVAGNASNINTVAADGTDIGTVAGISANVTTVAGISSDVTTVAGLETKMDTVIADASDIGTVAGISANVTTVANNSSNVTTVAGLETKMDTIIADAADIGAVAANINSVTTVSGISGDVTTVASKASDVETVADNIGDVQAASQNATNAAASAQAAAYSASTAGTHATNASASANQAANSATGADDSEAAAGISASAASSSASAASSSASSAASSASDANDSQAAAALSASGASVSASAAAVSAGNSETAADTWNSYYSTYLGAAASAPSTDLLGQPLQDGALYFNTTDDTMYVFNGSIWIAAESTINIVSVPTQLAADLTTNGNDIKFGDNDKAIFGASNDLQIYHDGTSNVISSEIGALVLRAQADDNDVVITSDNGSGGTVNYFRADGSEGSAILYNYGNAKLATTSTGIDVTGTATMGSLTVDGTSDLNGTITVGTTYTTDITGNDVSFFRDNGTSYIRQRGGHSLAFTTNDGSDRQRIKIDANGDISFYEDTGTTPKMVWDASAESLGIGTTTTTGTLNIQDSTPTIRFYDSNLVTRQMEINAENGNAIIKVDPNQTEGTSYYSVEIDAAERMRIDSSGRVGIGITNVGAKLDVLVGGDERLLFTTLGSDPFIGAVSGANSSYKALQLNGSELKLLTNGSEKARIDSSGNVGIGTSSPSAKLQLNESSATDVTFTQSNTVASTSLTQSANGSYYLYNYGAYNLIFGTSATERMRIDSSGNLLVGTTSATGRTDASSGEGIALSAGSYGGFIGATRSGANPLALNRLSTDGAIATFAKDGTTVGSIQSRAGVVSTIVLDPRTNGAGLTGTQNAVEPTNGSGVNTNGVLSLGTSSSRFKDLYLSGTAYAGVLNLKDGNTNGQINCLTPTGGKLYTNTYAEQISQIQGSEKMRLDSTGNLLVGTTSANQVGITLRGDSDYIYVARNEGATSYFDRKSTDGAITEFRKDGSPVGSIGSLSGTQLLIDSGGDRSGIRLEDNALLPRKNSAMANGTVSLGSATYPFKDLYLSGGVYLGGTGAANKLDDYEEGTWTPTLTTDGTDFTSVTYDQRTGGSYTKIGRMVHFQMTLVTDAITAGSASGNVVIGGLPFTPATVSGAGTNQYSACSVAQGENWNSSNNPTSARVHETSTYIDLFRNGTTRIVAADAQTGGNDNYVNISGTYTTA